MKNTVVKRSVLGVENCENKFRIFFFTNNTLRQ